MRLHFELALVQRLLSHSKAAHHHDATLDQLYEGRFRHDGKDVPATGAKFPTSADIASAKIPPGLWLVGDQGVYLMSNGKPGLPVDVPPAGNVVAYAEQADPSRRPGDWYEAKRAAFGGDDGVVYLAEDFVETMIAGAYAGRVVIDLTPDRAATIDLRPKRRPQARGRA